MVHTGVAFDWLPRYTEAEPAAGMSMPCRRTLIGVRPRVIVSPSVTPTTRPVKSSAQAGEAQARAIQDAERHDGRASASHCSRWARPLRELPPGTVTRR